MTSPFRRYERPRPASPDDELAALFVEAQARGVNIGAALALAASPQEAVANVKARLAAEARPEVQQVRENVRAPSGRGLVDFLRETFRRPEPPPDAGLLDRLLPGFRSLATPTLPESVIAPIPERFQPAARAIRELTSPMSLATLPIGGVKGGLLGAGGFVGGSQAGSEIAGPKGELIGGIVGGIAAPLAPAAGRATVRGGAKLAEEVGKTNVGNVLLPRAPKAIAKPLIYENLYPVERKLYGIESKGRLTLDEVEGARDYLYGPVDPTTGRRPGGVVSAEDTARIQNFEERYRGTHQLADRRREVARVLAKYAEPEAPKPTGPIAQAGFGGEMGPGQVARGAAEQPRMSQAPLSEIAASEADRIAKARSAVPVQVAHAATGGRASGRPTIPVFVRATEADRPAAQAFIDDLVTRAGDRTGSVGLQNVVPEGLDDLEIQDMALKLRTADALGIRATSDGRPISFLLASRPGQIAAQQYRRGAAVVVDSGVSGQGRNTYIGFNVGARPTSVTAPSTTVADALLPQPPTSGVPPISQEPAAGPRLPAAPPLAPTGAVSQAAVTSPPVATPPRPVIVTPPPAQPPAPPVAVSPPPRPPVPPGTPPSQPPLMPTRPAGIEQTLKQAKAIVERDRPGISSRLMDYVPGLKQIRHEVQPALDQPETMTTGWVGQGLAKGKVETSLQQARIAQLARLDAAFGKGATTTRDFKPAGVTFKGSAEQKAKYPYVGTLADIMERPALYNMSAKQRAAITATHNERSLNFGGTKADYALDIGEHPVQPGGVHMPSVGVGEDDIEIAGSLENALRRGRAKTRIYATLADRWAHDNTFRPETNVSKLFAADDDTLATLSGRKVLVEGLGGKTRLQVMQETHPELAAKMDILQKKLGSLRATAARIGGEQAEAIDNFMQSPLDPADLATLQADLNPRVGANAVGRQGPNFGKDFKALKSEVADVKAQVAALRPAWDNANLKPYVFVEDGVYRYFPVKEAKQAKELLKTSDSKLLPIIDNLRATAFGGDLSPVSIQGLTAWFADPIGVSRFVAQGKWKVSQASVLADMKANPASWQRFTAATGINPLGGTKQELGREFAAGYMSRIPKVGAKWEAWNESLYRPITKYAKDVFDNSYDAAVKHGLGPEQAAAVAADDATKIIPRSNFRRLGQSTRDAARYRAALTSVSFLTQPVALMNDAAKGLVKIGTKQTLTRSEVFAVKRVLTLVAATEAIAITSNIYHAQTHDLDIEQAVRDSLNPNSGKFMSLVLPNGARVGLGGPFRSIIHAVAPREVKIAGVDRPIPMPFAGVERFAKGKLGPVARIGYDELRNRDYYGKPIRTENFPVNILQGLEYALEGSAPLTVGSAAQQLRKGESIGTVVEEAASQFAGTNLQPDDPAYAATLRWKKDVKPYFDIPSNAKEAKDKSKTTRTDYRRKNPQVEAKLFIAGDVTSLSTPAAKREVVRLMKENNITVKDVKHLAPKDYESDDHAALRRYFEIELGVPKDQWAKPGKGSSALPEKPYYR